MSNNTKKEGPEPVKIAECGPAENVAIIHRDEPLLPLQSICSTDLQISCRGISVQPRSLLRKVAHG